MRNATLADYVAVNLNEGTRSANATPEGDRRCIYLWPRPADERDQLFRNASRKAIVSRCNWAIVFCSLRFSAWRNASRLVGRQPALAWLSSSKPDSAFTVLKTHIVLISNSSLFCYG